MSDPTLQSFTQALAAELDADLHEWEPAPDLAAVVERARELAPRFVTAEHVAAARRAEIRLATDPAWHQPRASAQHWQELAPFREELRAELDAQLDRHLGTDDRSPVRVRVSTWTRLRSHRVGLAAVTVAAAACGAVALWIAGSAVGLGRDSTTQDAFAAKLQAETLETTGHADLAGLARGNPRMTRPSPQPATDLDEAPSDPADELELELEPTAAETTNGAPPKNVSSQPSLDERIERLDADARRSWSAGDLKAAEQRLRKLIRIGGKRARVELAYGDLFTLLRQRSATHDLQRAWRRYLSTFPRGRFAEDARAGLCHASSGARATVCWRDYLEHHPRGAHRREAKHHDAGE